MGGDVAEVEINYSALIATGRTIASLDKKTLEQLTMIEQAVQTQTNKRNETLVLLKKGFFSIRKIAQLANLSRTTIYSKDVLKDYILAREEALTSSSHDDEIDKLRRELEEARAEIEALHRRDAESIILHLKIAKLEKENADNKAYINHEASLTSPNLSMRRNRKVKGIIQFEKEDTRKSTDKKQQP